MEMTIIDKKITLIVSSSGGYRWELERKTFLLMTIGYAIYLSNNGDCIPHQNPKNKIGYRFSLNNALKFLREYLIEKGVPYDQLPDISRI